MKKGVIFVLFTAIISGCSIFINKFGVKGIDSALFTFTKNIIVAMLLLGIVLGFKEARNLMRLNRKDWLSLILIGLVGGSIPFLLFFRGLQLSNGAVGSFIHKTMFIFVAIFAMVFLKERVSKKILIPTSLLLIGSALLLRLSSFELSVGAFMILGATLFWAVENVIAKRVLERVEPKVLAFGRLFFGSLFIMVYMLFTGKFSLVYSMSFAQFSWILITVPFLLLYVITWYTGLRYVKVTTATSILLLGSPVTTLLSFVFLGSTLSVMQAIGILLTLSGVVLMVMFLEKKPYSTISIA